MIIIINVIITTHGYIGTSLLQACEMILGPQKNVYSINFEESEGLPQLNEKLTKIINSIEENQEIIILTDLKGGSPYNISSYIALSHSTISVLYGVNLPMLLEVLITRDKVNLDMLVSNAINEGRNGIGERL